MINNPGGTGRVRHFDPRNLDHLVEDTVSGPERRASKALAAAFSQGMPSADLVEDERTLGAGAGGSRALEASTFGAGDKYHFPSPLELDQGDTPRCTAFGSLKLLLAGPVTQPSLLARLRGPSGEAFAQSWYDDIVAEDRRAGRVYTEGATTLATMLAGRARGYWSAFRWGYTLADFLLAIRSGPVVVGTDWREGMDDPDKAYGIIRYRGRNRGGHLYCIDGIDWDRGLARIPQTWGRTWGKRGVCYMPVEELGQAIADGGEMAVPTETRVIAA